MIPVQFIVAGAIAVASFSAGWLLQENRYGKQLSDIHAEHSLAFAQAQKEAHDTTVRLQGAVDAAERKARDRIAVAVRDAAAARTALGMLNEAADSALRAASDTHAACQSVAATATDLLGKCSAEYADVARHADEWASEVITLREAWPK